MNSATQQPIIVAVLLVTKSLRSGLAAKIASQWLFSGLLMVF